MAIFTCTSIGINNTYAFAVHSPSITVTPDALTFSYVEGKDPSLPQEVTITYTWCSHLEINILKENSNYEYSTDGKTFGPFPGKLELEAAPNKNKTNYTFYVRLKGGLATGTYDEIYEEEVEASIKKRIEIVGIRGKLKSTSKFVSLKGEVLPAPALTVTLESLAIMNFLIVLRRTKVAFNQ